MTVLVAAGCGTRDNPDTCIPSDNCGGGYCHPVTHTCVPHDGAAPETDGSPDGVVQGRYGDGAGGASAESDGPASSEPPSGASGGDGPALPADAGGACFQDDDCQGDRRHCSEARCVACTMNAHCLGEQGRCAPNRTCVECLAASDCQSMARPFCTANVCVECLGHGDCKTADRPLCAGGACVKCESGGGSLACAGKNDALPICTSGGACAECGESKDCKVEASPICIRNTCAPCTRDAECKERDDDKPGICLHPGEGRCAKDEETIYVENASPCSMAGGEGRSAMPFCQPQRALAVVNATRRIIRIRGPQELSSLDISASGGPITIIGQDEAKITSPASIGIQIRSGNVHIRGLASVGNQTGIVIAPGATVQLNRVLVEINREGGLLISNGATFDVSNSVFANNGRGSSGPTRFGGVFLGTPGAGRTGRFRASTVVGNLDVGVVCSSARQSLVGVLLFNNVDQDSFFCQEPTGREASEPRFSPLRPYRLTEAAPCREAIASGEMPVDDIDGEKRPYPDDGLADCGADEFHPLP
jgi:hypothetical protein